MKTLLIFPPSADAAHPPLGIPSLTAFLRQNGKDVIQSDLNLSSIQYLLTEENLRRCAGRIIKKLSHLETKSALSVREALEYRGLVKAALSEGFLIESLARALDDLRTKTTYCRRSSYAHGATTIWRAMEFVSASHFPAEWTPAGFYMSYSTSKSHDVLRGIEDRNENLFVSFFESVRDSILEMKPGLVGISINYPSQLIPGLTIASMLRDVAGLHITVGGSLIGYFDDRWSGLATFSHLVDSFIPYEGELPLLRLVEALERGDSLSKIPGLLRFHDGEIEYRPPERTLDIHELPVPDFTGLPIDDYLSPHKILPLRMTRGCYWGRCAFCTHDRSQGGNYCAKSVERVLDEIKVLSDQYKATHFYFVDDSLPPNPLRKLSKEIARNKLPYMWMGDLRFEPGISQEFIRDLAAGGCQFLIFGLESASDRVLGLMDKGTSARSASRILRSCRQYGIRTFLMFIVGFPQETEAEMDETVDFLGQHKDCISRIAFTTFVLAPKSRVYLEPQKYGIKPDSLSLRGDLAISASYAMRDGREVVDSEKEIERIKKHPAIQALLELHPIARIHLGFVPTQDGIDGQAPKHSDLDLNSLQRRFPVPIRNARLVPAILAFDIIEINPWLDQSIRKSVSKKFKKGPFNYAYLPESDQLIGVGRHGLLLLSQCNGERRLSDIMADFDEENKKIAAQYLLHMTEIGFVAWRKSAKSRRNFPTPSSR